MDTTNERLTMSKVGIVTMIFGALIVCSRGTLLFAPAATLRWFRRTISTNAQTRVLGVVALLIAVSMIWAGYPANTGLATILFIVGIFIFVLVIPALVLFPRVYMDLAAWVLPAESETNLFGWRVMGFVGMVIGFALFAAGMNAL